MPFLFDKILITLTSHSFLLEIRNLFINFVALTYVIRFHTYN